MMKRIYLLLCLLYPLSTLGAQKPVQLNLHIAGSEKKSVTMHLAGDETIINLDEKGNGVVRLNLQGPQYATLQNFKLFLEPGKDITITSTEQGDTQNVEFSGANGPENELLNSGSIFTPNTRAGEASRGEISLQEAIESFLQDPVVQRLSESFKKMETQKTRFIYMALASRNNNLPDSALIAATVEDEAYLETYEYQRFLQALNDIHRKRGAGEGMGGDSVLMPVLSATKHFKNPKIIDYLIDDYARKYIQQYGANAATDQLVNLYNKDVSGKNKKEAFKVYYNKFLASRVGVPCFNFSFPDADGKLVSLADFKGKYVLLDFWATWCGPCAADMPYLHKLESRFSDKNIVFISLSVDQGDKYVSRWKEKAKLLPGIQLLDTSNELKEQFVINYIPRYILLDKDGRVLDAHLPMAQDPKMAAVLEALF